MSYDEIIVFKNLKCNEFFNNAIDIITKTIKESITKNPYNNKIKILYDKNVLESMENELIEHFTKKGFYISCLTTRHEIKNDHNHIGLLINLEYQSTYNQILI